MKTLDEIHASPAQIRKEFATGQRFGDTSGLCPGYAQANLVILPKDWAFEFLLFCQRNPQPCPILEVLDPGSFQIQNLANLEDIRNSLPRYRIWEEGKLVSEPDDVLDAWREDLVTFLLGCSFSFEAALQDEGIPIRHLEQGRNVSMYRTNIPTNPAGRLKGPMVVSMRPIQEASLDKAKTISGRFMASHGMPVHAGDPAQIGIPDLSNPDYGDAVSLKSGDVPVFWACGVTPQAVLMDSGVEFAITHAPGHMFISDLTSDELEKRDLMKGRDIRSKPE